MLNILCIQSLFIISVNCCSPPAPLGRRYICVEFKSVDYNSFECARELPEAPGSSRKQLLQDVVVPSGPYS